MQWSLFAFLILWRAKFTHCDEKCRNENAFCLGVKGDTYSNGIDGNCWDREDCSVKVFAAKKDGQNIIDWQLEVQVVDEINVQLLHFEASFFISNGDKSTLANEQTIRMTVERRESSFTGSSCVKKFRGGCADDARQNLLYKYIDYTLNKRSYVMFKFQSQLIL